MTTAASDAISDAKEHLEDAVRTAGPVLQVMARFGLVAKGSVYILMGALALRAALHHGGATTDQRGAMRTILHQPFGRTMLAAAGVGLCGYALWRGGGPERMTAAARSTTTETPPRAGVVVVAAVPARAVPPPEPEPRR